MMLEFVSQLRRERLADVPVSETYRNLPEYTSALAPDGGLADKHDFYKSGQFSKENSNRRRRSSLSVCLQPAVCTAPLTPTKPMDTLRLLGNVRRRAATNTTFMERKWEAESVGVGTVRPHPQHPKVRQQTRTTAG